jgi:hypothetical protein
MKEPFMTDIWDMVRYGDWLEKVTGLIISSLAAVVIVGVGFIAFIAADSIGIESTPEPATVTSKSYSPEVTTTTFMDTGNGIMMPVITTTPPSWHAWVVTVNGARHLHCSISQGQFNFLSTGRNVEVGIGAGRFSGGDYCTHLRIPMN